MIPKIYKEEIFRIWQFFFCNIHGIKGLLLRKISQIYFLFLNLVFFFPTRVYYSLFYSKRALDRQSFITKSQALIHGKSLLFFFLSSLNCITSNKNEKGHSSYISPLHMSIILEMSIWQNSTAQRWVTSSPRRKNISKENKHNQSKIKKRPKGLGAPLSWNSSYSVFTSLFIIF